MMCDVYFTMSRAHEAIDESTKLIRETRAFLHTIDTQQKQVRDVTDRAQAPNARKDQDQ